MAEQLAPVIAEALARIDAVVAVQQEFDPARATRPFTIAPNSHLEFALVQAIVAQLRAHAPGIRMRSTPYGSALAETGVISGTTARVLGRIVDPPDNLVVQHRVGTALRSAGARCLRRIAW